MTIKELRATTGLTQKEFGNKFNIPTMSISNWEQGACNPPKYIPEMMERIVELEKTLEIKNGVIQELLERMGDN